MLTPQIILASSSKSRYQLLTQLQVPFGVDVPEIDECSLADESPQMLVVRLAEEKARAVAARHQKAIIIGADQVAVLADQVIGKPGNYENAYKQLKQISGKKVDFITGLAVLNSESECLQITKVRWKVYFRNFCEQEIVHYLKKQQPYQCACSFVSEELGLFLVEKFEGEDPSALIGLPLLALIRLLRRERIEPLLL